MLQHAQWLDGAFLSLVSDRKYGASLSWINQTISWLKIKALFGAEISLTDAQLNDSVLIMHLFSQPSFRRLIEHIPHFLQLNVHRNRTKENSQFGKTTTSLNASLREDWISSTFANSNISKRMASIILNAGVVDLEKELHRESSFNKLRSGLSPRDGRLIEGLLYALSYYSTNPEAMILVSEKAFDDLYSVLERTSEIESLSPNHQEQIAKTIDFIQKNISNPDEWKYQSKVFTTLDEVYDKRHPNYKIIQHTTHHAWNAALENSLNAESASLGFTNEENAVQVGVYLDYPTDTFLPANIVRGKYSATKYDAIPILPLNIDITALRWEAIRDLMIATGSTAILLQEAISSVGAGRKNQIKNALNKHAENLAYHTRPYLFKAPLVPNWIWYLGEGIAFVINKMININPDMLDLMMPFVPGLFENGLQYGEFSLLTNTYKKWGKKMVPQISKTAKK